MEEVECGLCVFVRSCVRFCLPSFIDSGFYCCTLSDLYYPDMGNALNTSWQLVESMQLTGGAKCDRSKDTWSVLMTTCHRSSSIRNVIVTGKSWQCTIHYDDICDFTILLMCVFNCCNKTQSVKASSF